MVDLFKTWKEKPLTIEQFEDLWNQNDRLEVAKALLHLLKQSEHILLKDKISFLCNSIIRGTDSKVGLKALAIKIFLEIMPKWDSNFEVECHIVLLEQKDLLPEDRSGWEGKIKTFIHSFLNTYKKEEMNEYIIAKILINNEMLEELVNYNFVSIQSARILWNFLFAKPCNALDIRAQKDEYWQLFIDAEHGSEWAPTPEKARRRIKELLCSWDKVENRHALATLWTLLAKRGDLEKIFGDETSGEKWRKIVQNFAGNIARNAEIKDGSNKDFPVKFVSDIIAELEKSKKEFEELEK